MSDSEGNKIVRQRKFYLYMSPFDGHDYAEKYGKFTSPSLDIMEAEVRDVLALWLKIQQSSIGEVIADSAWWMLRLMDPDNRKGAEESMEILDGLTSFGMSLLGQLVDLGFVTMTEEVDIPEIVTSADLQFNREDFDFLKQVESLWEDNENDE